MTQEMPMLDSRVKTGVRNLDSLLNGGLPRLSVTLIGGTPGAGKTILAEQICFHNASPESRVLFVQTLSEPTAKTLRYVKQFSFFDPKKLENGSVHFVDLGGILRNKGLEQALVMLIEQLKRIKPAFVVIDSFKVFSDLASSAEDIRKFTYETAIALMAWECTSFLLGEFTPEELAGTPLSSIVDGIFLMTGQERSGEQQRFLQVLKMRGTYHDRDEHPFSISSNGIEIYAPRLEIQHRAPLGIPKEALAPCKTGIAKFDALIEGGIPVGSSILVSGASGTGKTVFCLESIYRCAQKFNEKGIYFSFDESPEELKANAHRLGWDLEREIKRGMIDIVHVPQTSILVERDLLMMRDAIEKMQAKRVVVDSLSSFLYKIRDPQAAREKIVQLTSLIRDARAMGLFCANLPFESGNISQFGVEEAIMDGIVILTAAEHGLDRERYLEVYKMRNTSHKMGRQKMMIEKKGISIFSVTRKKTKKKR